MAKRNTAPKPDPEKAPDPKPTEAAPTAVEAACRAATIEEAPKLNELLTPQQRARLMTLDAFEAAAQEKIHPEHVSAPAPGQHGEYLPAKFFWENLLLDYGHNYSTEVLSCEIVKEQQVEVMTRDGQLRTRWEVLGKAICRIRINDDFGQEITRREDVGFSVATRNNEQGILDAYDQASKAAVTDAYKRAGRTLSYKLGLALQFKSEDRETADKDDGPGFTPLPPKPQNAKPAPAPTVSALDAKKEDVKKPVEAKPEPAKEEPKPQAATPEKRQEVAAAMGAAVGILSNAMGVAPGSSDLAPDAPKPEPAKAPPVEAKPGPSFLWPIPAGIYSKALEFFSVGKPVPIAELNKLGLKEWLGSNLGGDRDRVKALWGQTGIAMVADAAATLQQLERLAAEIAKIQQGARAVAASATK